MWSSPSVKNKNNKTYLIKIIKIFFLPILDYKKITIISDKLKNLIRWFSKLRRLRQLVLRQGMQPIVAHEGWWRQGMGWLFIVFLTLALIVLIGKYRCKICTLISFYSLSMTQKFMKYEFLKLNSFAWGWLLHLIY